jgi:tellurite resistance protein TerC
LAGEFFAGWLTEYSLSVDNLFIFLLIMAKFAVPERYQQYALMIGIIIAIVLRGFFIWVGAAAINNFSWVFYIFGAFLIYTAIKLAREGESDDEEFEENAFMKAMERVFPATNQFHGTKSFIKENGKRLATPMFFVILALGTTDLLFALDSIPAIYGLTREPYIVLVANLFALMGLRQLYFLLGGLLQKLVYLSIGLSVLLAFIGVKLLLHALHENELPFINGGEHVNVPEIPIAVSLGAIVVILGVTTIASLWKSKRDAKAMVAGSDSTTD